MSLPLARTHTCVKERCMRPLPMGHPPTVPFLHVQASSLANLRDARKEAIFRLCKPLQVVFGALKVCSQR
jgi:hypothetical protein